MELSLRAIDSLAGWLADEAWLAVSEEGAGLAGTAIEPMAQFLSASSGRPKPMNG